MRTLTISLKSFTQNEEFELLEISRRKVYRDGEATKDFVTVYKVLIKYTPIEIKIDDSGKLAEQAETVAAYCEAGKPLFISFNDCSISISPKSQYELSLNGTAKEATLIKPK